MFELDRFIEECRAAVREDPSHKAAREVVARAVSDPAGILAGLGEPRRAMVDPLYRGDDLTILNVIWGPRMTIMPHNHLMWAVIGIYTGRENNIFWRRLPGETSAQPIINPPAPCAITIDSSSTPCAITNSNRPPANP